MAKYQVLIEARYLIDAVVEAENEEAACEDESLLDIFENTPWYIKIDGRTWRLPDGEGPQVVEVWPYV